MTAEVEVTKEGMKRKDFVAEARSLAADQRGHQTNGSDHSVIYFPHAATVSSVLIDSITLGPHPAHTKRRTMDMKNPCQARTFQPKRAQVKGRQFTRE